MNSFSLICEYLTSPMFLRGAGMTLLITFVSVFFGVIVGLLVALMQESKNKALGGVVMAYLWLFRGTPVLFQIIFIYNVLPSIGITLSSVMCGVIALSLNEGAYMGEIMRSGLQAVGKGQRGAAVALGLKEWQVIKLVVIPQALRIIIPPIGNQCIGMLKLSALVSVVAVEELLLVSNQAASSNFRYFESLVAAGVYYLAFTTLFMYIQSRIESWAKDGRASKRAGTVTPVTPNALVAK
jgi:polar amino acid transport system permease protein